MSSSTAEESWSSHWRLYQCNQTRWHLHQGILKKSSVVCYRHSESVFHALCVSLFSIVKFVSDLVLPVATWTQSNMKRPYGTMKKFIRQRKPQVSCSPCFPKLWLNLMFSFSHMACISLSLQITSKCWRRHRWSWRRAKGKITTRCSGSGRMLLRTRSRKRIANEPSCITQVAVLVFPHSSH